MCKIGLGADECKNEMALAELTEKYHFFCDIQRVAAQVIEEIPTDNNAYQDFTMISYETIAQGLRSAIHDLKHLGYDRVTELNACMNNIDRAVGNALSQGGSMPEEVLELLQDRISTLHFPLNPNNHVTPGACRSVHDILRFVLEAARNIMFDLCVQINVGEKIPKQLVGEVPMQYWVVDLDGGIKEGTNGKKVRLEDILSPPMHALWQGLTAIPWPGPPPVNAKGLLSVMFQCSRDPCLDPGVVRPFAKKNHIIISKRFCNLTSRLGFHFTTAEAFIGKGVHENYASFEFKGGAACIDRRERRVRLIAKILERFGFYTDIDGDDLLARADTQPTEYLLETLKVLGYLMTHTRQLDMVMCSDASINWYYEEMLTKMASFVSIAE